MTTHIIEAAALWVSHMPKAVLMKHEPPIEPSDIIVYVTEDSRRTRVMVMDVLSDHPLLALDAQLVFLQRLAHSEWEA